MPPKSGLAPSTHTEYGLPIPPVAKLRVMSPSDWGAVVLEWASSLEPKYKRVRRYGAPGDLGLDVIGFVEDKQDLRHPWDNYQCKHYDHPITMSNVRIAFVKSVITRSAVGTYRRARVTSSRHSASRLR
jgi:hypothetical protein